MKAGTTEPHRSEDLWAQERRATPQVRTQRRAAWLADGRLEGWRKRTVFRRDVGIRLKRGDRGGRRQTELRGAWSLKPYWGKPTVRNFTHSIALSGRARHRSSKAA